MKVSRQLLAIDRARRRTTATSAERRVLWSVAGLVAHCFVLAGCAPAPLIPYSEATPPLVLAPAAQAGIKDDRGRFREIFCAVLQARHHELPDYRDCEEALTRVGEEPEASGAPVDLGPSRRGLIAAVVPGVGWDCISEWLQPAGAVAEHLRRFGYDQITLEIDALSSSSVNARRVRDALLEMQSSPASPEVVLIGYSKGAPDVLQAVVDYPEIRDRLAAVVSIGGAVGGSPLANRATQSELELLQHFPSADCELGDRGALESLKPTPRHAWLAHSPLPPEVRYYSIVTFPDPEQISRILRRSYRQLSQVDSRNDSQLIFYDQLIPGSTLAAYLNADHWAIAVPIARSHARVGRWLVDHNAYPREALVEALLRYLEEQLAEAHD